MLLGFFTSKSVWGKYCIIVGTALTFLALSVLLSRQWWELLAFTTHTTNCGGEKETQGWKGHAKSGTN